MFTENFKTFAYEGDTISCDVGKFHVVATIYWDDNQVKPDECDDGFWPSRDPKAAGYVNPDKFDAEMKRAEQVMAAWKNDEWFFCGVAVQVFCNDIALTGKYHHALWGIECNYPDSDNSYLQVVANEFLDEALDDAKTKIASLCEQ